MEEEVELLCAPCAPQDPGERLLNSFEKRDLKSFKVSVSDVLPDNPNCNTCLIKACGDPTASEYVKLLLSIGVDPNQADKKKKGPLQIAAEASNVEALHILLQDKRVDVQVLDTFGDTVLHLVTKGKGHSEDQAKCVELILGHQMVDFINKKNRKGHSAILLAAKNCHITVIDAFLKHPNIDLDHATFLNGDTARHLISQNSSSVGKLPPPIAERKVDDDALMTMLYYGKDQMKQFCTMVTDRKYKDVNHHDGSHTYLQRACFDGLTDVVQVLLQHRADPEGTCPHNPTPPVMYACAGGSSDILQLLINYNTNGRLLMAKTVDGDTALIQLIRSWNDSNSGYEQCLKIILDMKGRTGVDLNASNTTGNTALHYAAITGDRQLMLALLKNGAYIGGTNDQDCLPITHISYEVLEAHFDECLASRESRFHDEYEIKFDYSCLVPPGKQQDDTKQLNLPAGEDCELGELSSANESQTYLETEPVLFMSRHPDLRPLLKHPVLTSFLELKWQRISALFMCNMLFYVAFVAFITMHILWGHGRNHSGESSHITANSTNPLQRDSQKPGTYCKQWVCIDATDGDNDSVTTMDPLMDTSENWFNTFNIVHGIAISLWAVLLLRELCQFAVSPKRYFSWASKENIFEICLIISSAIVLFQIGNIPSMTRSFAAVTILLSWGELVLLIGRYPTLSTYIEMLKRVSLNFLKFLAWYSILIIAFALSFYTLFRDSDEQDNFFADPGMSVFKTMVMMTGEFDVSDIPFVEFPVLSHMVFVMFVFLIAIVLFNLLNGLAVSDTQAIKDDAELVGYVSRVNLVAYIERTIMGQTRGRCACWQSFLRCQCLARRVTLFTESTSYIGHLLPNQCLELWVASGKGSENKEPKAPNCNLARHIVKAAETVIAMKNRPTELDLIRTALEVNKEKLSYMEMRWKETDKMLKEILSIVGDNHKM